MALYIRMALYFAFSFLAAQGIGAYDHEAQTLTLSIENLATAITGLMGYLATFAGSRMAKANGGVT